MKKFLKDLEIELKKNNLSDEEISEILLDHQEMIETALNEGLNPEDLEAKFGDPVDLAKELSSFSDKKEEGRKGKIMKTKEFLNVQEGYDVSISLISDDIEFQFSDEDKIVVNYTGRRNFDDYEITFEDNTFVLNYTKKEKRSYFSFNSYEGDFEIILPKIKLGTFKLKEISGDVRLDYLDGKKLNIETTNGDFDLGNLTLERIHLNTINGDIEMSKVRGEVLIISQISGDLTMDDVVIEDSIESNTVSGDLDIKNTECGDFTLKTVSGDIDGEEFYPKTLSLKSVSGDITIVNSDESREINVVHKKTVSGDIKIKIKK